MIMRNKIKPCPFCGLSERDTVAPDGLGIPAVSVQSRPDRTLDPENAELRHSADSAASQTRKLNNER